MSSLTTTEPVWLLPTRSTPAELRVVPLVSAVWDDEQGFGFLDAGVPVQSSTKPEPPSEPLQLTVTSCLLHPAPFGAPAVTV